MFKSLLKKKHERLTLEACEAIVAEDDRVYRNQVAYFSKTYHPCNVSGLGLAKARLFGSMFPAYAYFLRWMDDETSVKRVLNICSGVAAEGVALPGSKPFVSHEKLRSLGTASIMKELELIGDEFRHGPSIAPDRENLTAGFRGLVGLCHEALLHSVGDEHYNDSARTHFEILFKGGLIGRLSATARLMEVIG